jgi:hypothetical protein
MNGPVVTLSWSAPTLNTDGSAITPPLTYNLYQGGSATSLAKVQTGLTSTSTTVSAGLTPGSTQFFSVTAVENGQESAQETPVSVGIPEPVPSAPTGLTVVLTTP